MWVVVKDGRVLERGFPTEQAAWRWANAFTAKAERLRAGTHIRVPVLQVAPDRVYQQAANENWRDCARHTTIVRP